MIAQSAWTAKHPSVSTWIDAISRLFLSERAEFAQRHLVQVHADLLFKLPELREKCRYTERAFDAALSDHSATRMLFRMWETAPTSAKKTKVYEAMRVAARFYGHLIEAFRELERAQADLELAELATRKVARALPHSSFAPVAAW